jgi:diacylglycerol O-acyltransferase
VSSSRLTPLDAGFLQIEDGSTAHMHVAALLILEGPAPPYAELAAELDARLSRVPRYRQRLRYPPLPIAPPEWVDDPNFRIIQHLRRVSLPRPGTEEQLKAVAGRILSRRLDRRRPLWEMWVVDHLDGDRWAILSKVHHCLVDGVGGVDVTTLLFDTEPAEEVVGPWAPHQPPGPLATLVSAAGVAAAGPLRMAGAVMREATRPRHAVGAAGRMLGGLAAVGATAVHPAPHSIYNVEIGPDRRFTWVRASLTEFRDVKNFFGCTVNDVVLSAVAGTLRRHLRRRGAEVDGRDLVAMVPVNVRHEPEHTLGNRVASMYVPLPVGVVDPLARLRQVAETERRIKHGGQVAGGEVLTQLGVLLPPALMHRLAQLVAGPWTFNLTVTNVPGPRVALSAHGRRLLDLIPMVPLAPRHAFGVAVMSYQDGLCFGLVGDREAMRDLEVVADDLRAELDLLLDEIRSRAMAVGQSTSGT